MIVVDSSALLSAVSNDGAARAALREEQLHAPHLVDIEVLSALRRVVLAGRVSEPLGRNLLSAVSSLAITRHASAAFLERIWQLKENVSAYDAAYVALAERLECPLITADARLASSTGPRCRMVVVPR